LKKAWKGCKQIGNNPETKERFSYGGNKRRQQQPCRNPGKKGGSERVWRTERVAEKKKNRGLRRPKKIGRGVKVLGPEAAKGKGRGGGSKSVDRIS